MKTIFSAGTRHDGTGINYLVTDDKSIYAEVVVPEGASEDYGYLSMKCEVYRVAAEHGVTIDEDFYDTATEQMLDADAYAGEVFVDWRG